MKKVEMFKWALTIFVAAVFLAVAAPGMTAGGSWGGGHSGGGSWGGGHSGGGSWGGGHSGGGHWGGGHYGGHHGSDFSVWFGGPFWGSWGYPYYYPYYYPYAYPYSNPYAPPYYYPDGAASSMPQEYVERAEPDEPVATAPSGVWYFCMKSKAYYPYVKECPGGWQTVFASPQSEADESVPRQPGVWYYCPESKAYYPYVKECAGGWKSLPAQPPVRR